MKGDAGLPREGVVRIGQFVGDGKAIPISKSGWWAGVKSGRYPKPIKLSLRVTVWRVEDIRALIQQQGEIEMGGGK